MDAPSRRGSTFAFLRKVVRIALEEVDQIVPIKTVAELSSKLLPEQTFNRTRTAALRAAGARIGAHSLLMGPVRITGAPNPCKLLSIGEWTMVNGPLHVDLGAPVDIGSGVRFGHNVSLLTITHEIGEPHLRAGTHRALPVRIGHGVWIASGAIILPGVTVGDSSIVAAGAVVTRDVPPNTMVAGVPARVVRTLGKNSAESALAKGSSESTSANGAAETDGAPDSRSWPLNGRAEHA